jgi:hypothetical protein
MCPAGEPNSKLITKTTYLSDQEVEEESLLDMQEW